MNYDQEKLNRVFDRILNGFDSLGDRSLSEEEKLQLLNESGLQWDGKSKQAYCPLLCTLVNSLSPFINGIVRDKMVSGLIKNIKQTGDPFYDFQAKLVKNDKLVTFHPDHLFQPEAEPFFLSLEDIRISAKEENRKFKETVLNVLPEIDESYLVKIDYLEIGDIEQNTGNQFTDNQFTEYRKIITFQPTRLMAFSCRPYKQSSYFAYKDYKNGEPQKYDACSIWLVTPEKILEIIKSQERS